MKNQTFIPSDQLITSLYEEFKRDDTIISMMALRKKNNFGSKTGRKVQLAIYKKYGENNIKKICLSRCGKSRRAKSKGTYKPSPETIQKRAKAIKQSYINDPKLIELRRKNAYNTIVGRKQTDEEKEKRANLLRGKKRSQETKLRMSLAKKGIPLSEKHRNSLIGISRKKVNRSYPRSEETKKKLSIIAKQQWKDGIHTPTYRSKGQMGYNVEPEFIINGRPYDTYIPAKNLLVEYNGTYWHRDPRFYKITEEVKLIHRKDAEKINLAKSHGYDIVVVWQHDWESCVDKKQYLKDILNKHGKQI
jgi:hypothetical protein